MPFSGWQSYRLGCRTIYLVGTAFGILLAFPIWLFETRDPTAVTIAIMAGIALGIVFALNASFMPELFRTNVRDSGISLGFQLGAAIGCSLTTMIAAAIVARGGGAIWPVSVTLVALGLVTFFAVLSTREMAARPVRS